MYQDRLVKELKLAGICDIDAANDFLRKGYEADLNRRFCVAPMEEEDAHRPVSKEVRLRDVFCVEENRRVNNDWTIQYQGRLFQIRKDNKVCPPAGQKVVVRKDLEGRLTLQYKGEKIFYDVIEDRPKRLEPEPIRKSRVIRRPASNHPWKTGYFMGTKGTKVATV